MSADDLPELPPDARAALADVKKLVDPSDAARARMRSRLAQALPPPGGGDGGGGGADRAPRGATPTGAMPRVPLWTLAAALAVGGAAGLLYPRAPVERIVVVQAPPPAFASAAPLAPTSAPAASLAAIDMKDLPSMPGASAGAGASASADAGSPRGGSDLAAERALLDVARTALGRSDGANALAACDEHARKFPRGALAEEREAIAVQALVLEQHGEDARARAERFRKTHPRSILLPAVLAAAGIEP